MLKIYLDWNVITHCKRVIGMKIYLIKLNFMEISLYFLIQMPILEICKLNRKLIKRITIWM